MKYETSPEGDLVLENYCLLSFAQHPFYLSLREARAASDAAFSPSVGIAPYRVLCKISRWAGAERPHRGRFPDLHEGGLLRGTCPEPIISFRAGYVKRPG